MQIRIAQNSASFSAQSLYENDSDILLILEFGRVLSKTTKPNLRHHFFQLQKKHNNNNALLTWKVPNSISFMSRKFFSTINIQLLRDILCKIDFCAYKTTLCTTAITYNPYSIVASVLIHLPLDAISHLSKFDLTETINLEQDWISSRTQELQSNMYVAQINGWITSAHELMSSPLMTELINKYQRKLKDRENQIYKLLNKPKKMMLYDVAHFRIVTTPFANNQVELSKNMAEITQLTRKVLSDFRNKFAEKNNKASSRQFAYVWNIGFSFQNNGLISLIWNIYLLDEINDVSSSHVGGNQVNNNLSTNSCQDNLQNFILYNCVDSISAWKNAANTMGIQVQVFGNTSNLFGFLQSTPTAISDLMPYLIGDTAHSVNTLHTSLKKLKYFACGHL